MFKAQEAGTEYINVYSGTKQSRSMEYHYTNTKYNTKYVVKRKMKYKYICKLPSYFIFVGSDSLSKQEKRYISIKKV